jgi:hypothetical protein
MPIRRCTDKECKGYHLPLWPTVVDCPKCGKETELIKI